MDLRHLRAFVAAAEERSFTKTARRLNISEPEMSRRIRKLEDELGLALFVRHYAGADLAGEARGLLEQARVVLAAVTDLRDTARSAKNPRAPAVTVGIAWGLWEAVNRIRAHHAKRFPEIPISGQDLCAERDLLHERRIDVAVLRPPVDDLWVESEPLFEERFVAILSDTHPLAARDAVTLAELASDPLLLYERRHGPGVYDKTLSLYMAAGICPQVVEAQPPPQAQGAMMLVAGRQGVYLGLASPFTQTHRVSGVAVVPIDEPDARLDVRIAWRKNESSRDVREFLRSARDVFPLKTSVPPFDA